MSDLDPAEVRRLFDYDPLTGLLRWRVKPSKRTRVGAVAGSPNHLGYIRVTIGKARHWAHHLAWAWSHGVFAEGILDHINGDPGDNRIANLRIADASLNQANTGLHPANTTGHRGVTWCRQTRLWRAQIVVQGRNIHLGRFAEIERAAAAYRVAADKHFGEFARQP